MNLLYRQGYMRGSKFVVLLLALLLWLPSPVAAATNDPLLTRQWGLYRVGAEAAWSVSKGAGVLIAVIDTGVHLEHPDLQSQIVPGTSVVDDRPPEDNHGHGTLIAGIAAAAAGNGEGISGVAPEAKILPVRVFDQQGSASSAQVARAIRFAIDAAASRRAKLVLNLSFVGTSQLRTESGAPTSVFGDEAVRRAIIDAATGGAAVITAAGNEGRSTTAFDAPPGSGIIVVGASDQQDGCAAFTNYGPGLDVLAPGVDILTTFWNPSDGTEGYARADGTSMAVPFVAGAAALLMSNGMTNVQAINRIIATASGPGVSCAGESNQYRVIDIPLALGISRDTTGAQQERTVIVDPDAVIPAGSGAATPEGAGPEGEVPENLAAEEQDIALYELTWERGVALLFFLVAINLVIAVVKREQYL